MGGRILRKVACLDPSCGSSDARAIYEKGDSYCFSCLQFFPPTEEDKAMSDEVKPKQEPMFQKVKSVDVTDYPFRPIKDRGISKEVCEFYQVRTSFDAETGTAKAHYYPYPGGAFKVRTLPKEFTWIGKTTELFGKDKFNAGGRRVVITEGEIDALSVAQASFEKYGKFYPVVSVPSASTLKPLIENREWLRTFDEVILCFDNDDAGKKATDEAITIVGIDKVKLIRLPNETKDANDVYKKHGGNRLMQCIYDAQKHIPSGIITKDQLWEALCSYNDKESIPYPPFLHGVTSKTKGIRTGEISLFVSGTSCLGKGTEVLMFDGSLKKVEDIVVHDIVMGDDGTPRNVLDLSRGTEQLYYISHNDGTGFICNASHIHSVVNIDTEGRWGLKKGDIVDVKVSDYIGWSTKRKHLSKTFKAEALEFYNESTLEIHPYLLGVWLGDGYSAGGRLSAHEDSVEILSKLESLGQKVISHNTVGSWGLPDLVGYLRELGVLDNKHIPEKYLVASLEERMELLAGLIDTDGCALKDGRYEFSQKDELITDQVARLARSLGFKVSKSKQKNNKFGNCFRLWICGPHVSDIPVAISYKKIPFKIYRTNQRFSETHITPLEVGDFYGFELDGNQRFVLGNFTVTHNCGKSTIMREIMLHTQDVTPNSHKIGVVALEEAPAESARKLSGMKLNRNPAKEEITIDELKPGFEQVFGDDRYILLDHQGSLKDETILDKLEYMALSGCKYIIIDHITILVSEGAGDLQGNEAIDKIMNDLLRFCKRHDVWIGLVSHLRKTMKGKAFEEGEMPNLDDIKGSGSIKQISFDIIAFARNLQDTDEIKRNTIKMAVLKCRYTGLTGPVEGAYYDYDTGRFKSIDAAASSLSNTSDFKPVAMTAVVNAAF